MSMTDSISDMLTRIRNANMRLKDSVDVPSSRLKVEIARVLKQGGYIKEYKEIKDNKQGVLRVYLKYGPQRQRVINELIRESKPGRRIYKGINDVGRVLGGLGMAVLSTPKGILSDRQCREQRVGGELLLSVW